MNDRLWLAIATVFYGVSFSLCLYRLGARLFRPNWFQFGTFLIAFGFHTLFMVERGKLIGHCPISNLFEVSVFVAWSLGLAYLVVGPLYRLTLLGVLTAPVIFIVLVLSQILPLDQSVIGYPRGYGVELHAALSILAYGALGIACLTGVVYLIQDYCLRKKHLNDWVLNLPSLNELVKVNRQLMIYGLILLLSGFVSGFFLPERMDWVKLSWFIFILLAYVGVIIASFFHKISGRKTALLSLVIYALILSTFWSVKHFTPYPQFL